MSYKKCYTNFKDAYCILFLIIVGVFLFMKKKILLTTLVVTTLAGCNHETEEENLDDVKMTQEKVEQKNELQYDKFKMEDDTLYLKNGDEESEVTLTHSDDVLIKQKTSTNSTYKARGYKDKTDAKKKLIEENEALKKLSLIHISEPTRLL